MVEGECLCRLSMTQAFGTRLGGEAGVDFLDIVRSQVWERGGLQVGLFQAPLISFSPALADPFKHQATLRSWSKPYAHRLYDCMCREIPAG